MERQQPLQQSQQPRKRQQFTWAQVSTLEGVFEQQQRPPTSVVAEIAQKLDVPMRSVQVWFQNRRQKAKREEQAAELPLCEPARE